MKRYSDLKKLKTFEERFEYLKLFGKVGESTFGYDRYLNQVFYRSEKWKSIRRDVIIRDNGCDLGIVGREIGIREGLWMDNSFIVIHHMNPITIADIEEMSDNLLNPEFLICCSVTTHKAIHYSNADLLVTEPIERRPNDTCPWRS